MPIISISFFNLSIYWNIIKRSRKKSQPFKLQPLNEEKHDEPYVITAEDTTSSGIEEINRAPKDSVRQWFNKRNPVCSKNETRTNANLISLSRDKNVAKSLSVLVFVFILCWAPYSIMAACRDLCYQTYVSDVTTWLLWINSAINPVLYPFCHKSFKRAFTLTAKKIFSVCKIHF